MGVRNDIEKYCSKIGGNPLLVQGAGGNVSWKDHDTLWVKASGTWLADAGGTDIFVQVDLTHLKAAIERQEYDATPLIFSPHGLKPSIETMLHAIMPHAIVAHLHPVDALTFLVQQDADDLLRKVCGSEFSYVTVDYRKPGAELAKAVAEALDGVKGVGVDVVFLKNHGLVMGGKDVATVERLTDVIQKALKCSPEKYPIFSKNLHSLKWNAFNGGDDIIYAPIEDNDMHHLATAPTLLKRVGNDWAIYPDHVVFLSGYAHIFDDLSAFERADFAGAYPDVVFIRDVGVFVTARFNLAKMLQLRCYFEILLRINQEDRLHTLSATDVDDLLNWDAEKYRMRLAK